MRELRLRQTVFVDSLFDMVAGQLAVGRDVVGLRLRHRLEDRRADFHRGLVELLFYAERACMSGATLNYRYLRIRHERQRLRCLAADVLYACMTRHVIGDLAERRIEIGLEQAIAM